MATWVTHFRIAEAFIKRQLPVSRIDFLVGNIGPDCGLMGEDGVPSPPKEITHWMHGKEIGAEAFCREYLQDSLELSDPKTSYYLGYYFHLVTDQEWTKLVKVKEKESVYQDIINKPEFVRLVKRDWYGLDFLHLQKHKDSIFWTDFQQIQDFPEYMSYFPPGQTLTQIRNITNFYHKEHNLDNHSFIYLTSDETDEFVDHTVRLLEETVSQRWNVSAEESEV